MKSVLISIQPYWVFLITAKVMGCNVVEEKTIEVRKNYPKDENWDKIAKIYCSKEKKSFAKIPKEYQSLMAQFLGKVIGEFVCDEIITAKLGNYCNITLKDACLDALEMMDYADDKPVYGWHISDLVIYDKPRELSEFYKKCEATRCEGCEHLKYQGVNSNEYDYDCEYMGYCIPITRPPQSWCYVEEVQA